MSSKKHKVGVRRRVQKEEVRVNIREFRIPIQINPNSFLGRLMHRFIGEGIVISFFMIHAVFITTKVFACVSTLFLTARFKVKP